ncbi:MAG: glycosyltransferase [Planctomycetota bacterium]
MNATNNRRIAIVSHTLPPDSNGQALVLGRLLEGFDAGSCCLISGEACPETSLPIEHVKIPAGPRLKRIRPLESLIDPLQLSLDLRWWSRSLEKVVRDRQLHAIVACTGEVYELPAAARAAKRAGVPFFPYIFDWYRFKYSCLAGLHGWMIRRYASRAEGPMLRAARRVIVPNEPLRDEYQRRYRVASLIVRNPTDFAPPESVGPAWPDEPLTICYTGAVYQAQLDAFTRLLAALDQLPEGGVRLELYTDATPDWLDQHGLRGPIDHRPRVPLAEVQQVQRGADVLFLPLAFHSPYPEIIRTSAPGKMGDYLASGRPILAHAPADSFVSWYFREHECGVVVDNESVDGLAKAVQRLASDEALRRRVAANARRCAERDFGIDRARRRFGEAVGLPVGDAPASGPSPLSDQPHAA